MKSPLCKRVQLLVRSIAILATSLILASPVGAAESPEAANGLERLLQTEISGASRYVQPLAEAPASASVLTAEDFRRYGFRDIGEALQTMRGIYLTQDRTYGYMGVRGFNRPGDYNSRILLLMDGFSVNNPIYDQAMIGNEAPLDVDWIKRLEFVPGAASVNYGGNALFGIVNAVRWSGGDLNGSRVSVDFGSGDAHRVSMMAGHRFDGGGTGWRVWWRIDVQARICLFPNIASRGAAAAQPMDWMANITSRP